MVFEGAHVQQGRLRCCMKRPQSLQFLMNTCMRRRLFAHQSCHQLYFVTLARRLRLPLTSLVLCLWSNSEKEF